MVIPAMALLLAIVKPTMSDPPDHARYKSSVADCTIPYCTMWVDIQRPDGYLAPHEKRNWHGFGFLGQHPSLVSCIARRVAEGPCNIQFAGTSGSGITTLAKWDL